MLRDCIKNPAKDLLDAYDRGRKDVSTAEDPTLYAYIVSLDRVNLQAFTEGRIALCASKMKGYVS